MDADKRYYTRYKVSLKGRVATEKGFSFPVEVLDVSTEGARLRTDSKISLVEDESVNIVIKWKVSIKAKAEVRWIKKDKFFTEFGVRFTEMDMANREVLSSLVSEFALTSLSDLYTR